MLPLGLALFSAAVSVTLAQDDLLVKTTGGNVQGHMNIADIKEWNGIPYAKPPVDSLRWQYPQVPDAFDGTYEATFNAPACAQVCNLPPGNCPEPDMISEDCLYLTVTAPKEPPTDPAGYPVLFWIHGGAYTQGMGNCALYNGTRFAELGILTVVINYRLGALGFIASESMQGNYGHMDQRLAMEWTQANIAGFGGNPNKVSAGGQSAGAMSVGAHLIGPGSKGLFQQGIMESNPFGIPFHERDSATANANDVFAYLNCSADDVACMMTKSIPEILDAQSNAIKLDLQNMFINFLPFAPLVEPGGEIPEQPFYGVMAGNFDAVPILSGTVQDEGQLFVYELFTKPISEKAYNAILAGLFLKAYPEVQKAYPFDIVPGSVDGREAMNIMATDLLFYCPLRNATRGYQAVQEKATDTYVYRFEHVISFDCWGPDYTFCVGEVCHGSELCFVFDVFAADDLVYDPTSEEVQLMKDLSNGWANFIAGGNPNEGLPIAKEYAKYSGKSDLVLHLDEPGTEMKSHEREVYCDMWDRLGYFY